jgi:hypothetical protein
MRHEEITMDKPQYVVVDLTSSSAEDLQDTLNQYYADDYSPMQIFQETTNDTGCYKKYSYRIVFKKA